MSKKDSIGSNIPVSIENIDTDIKLQTDEVKEYLYSQAIQSNLKQIQQLKKMIEELQKKEIKLRDKIASQIYVQLYSIAPNAEKAASDAYLAADAFLTFREGPIEHHFTINPKPEPNEKTT